MYQNNILSKIRSVLRIAGVTNIVGRFLAKKDYELRFHECLLSNIRKDDTIYDIGANRGYYTKLFLEKATMGRVFAFEPIPECYQIISKLIPMHDNLTVFPIAIGNTNGSLPMSIGRDDLNATSSVSAAKEPNDILVEMKTVDNIASTTDSLPNVLKIDVEGYEIEVLKGMESTIGDKRLRVIAIEVHFSLLQRNGYKNGPKEIVDFLRKSKFRVDWIDPSHIVAKRRM